MLWCTSRLEEAPMWLGKWVSSPLVTCCGTGTIDSDVAAFTVLLNDWIARGVVTPSGGGTLPGLPDPRVPPNCAEAVLELTRTPAARVAATPTRSRNSRRSGPTDFFLEPASPAE